MKALIYRYGSICEPDIIEAFQKLGAEVSEITAEITDKQITPLESIRLTRTELEKGGFSCIFTINFFPWLAQLANIYHILYLSLIVDSPVLELYSDSLQLPYNRVFLFDRCLYDEFVQENPEHIFHIPLATNIGRSAAVIRTADDRTKVRFRHDISFIGSLYSEKCPYNRITLPDYERGFAEGLIEAQLKVYGYNFLEEALSDSLTETILTGDKDHYIFPEKSRQAYKALVAQQYLSVKAAEQERIRMLKMLSEHFQVTIYTGSDTSMLPHIHNRGFAKSHTEMPVIFNQSKINLNITAKSIRSGLSLRIFDVLGCGGFLITNYQAELPEVFEIGKELESYASPEELMEKCTYYLVHDSAREAIARRGYEKVCRLHTWDTRLLTILEKALEQ